MLRGLYTSASGMLRAQKKMDVVSNNLANVSTTGYKKDIAVSQAFPEMLTRRIEENKDLLNRSENIGTMRLGTDIVQIYTSYTQGRLNKTESDTDFSISGSDNAFFAVSVQGQAGVTEMYTRNGSFTINQAGYLTTREGYMVLGQNGPIQVGNRKLTVDKDGSISLDGVYVDTLRIVEFVDTTALQKQGNNLVQAPVGVQVRPFSGQVIQGYIEDANVNPVEEMVDMITVMRSYEANQKVIQAYDNTLDKTVNDIGRI